MGKINIFSIILLHIRTLSNLDGKIMPVDFVIQLGIPVIISIFFIYGCGYLIDNNFASNGIMFGSVIAALLISSVMLVFDKKQTLKKNNDNGHMLKLVDQLSHNICFTILESITLTILCLISVINFRMKGALSYFFLKEDIFHYGHIAITFIIIFLSISIFLSFLMILKRISIMFND